MKALKLTVLSLALISTGAMANTAIETNDSGRQVITTTKTVKPAGVGVEIGTLGYGANLSWGVTDSVELQLGWNGGNPSIDDTVDTTDSKVADIFGDEYANLKGNFKAEIDGNSPYIGLQTRPFKNWFTVGTGVIVPDVSANTSFEVTGTSKLTVNNTEHTLNAGDSISFHAETKQKLAPYATIGLRPNIGNRFGLSAELGAVYLGKIDTNIEVKNGGTTPTATTDTIRTDLNKKVDDVSHAWWPIVKLGATMRF